MKVLYINDNQSIFDMRQDTRDENRKYIPSIILLGSFSDDMSVEHSWRKKAIEYLENKNYEGLVYVPEKRGNEEITSDTWKWINEAADVADCLVFWETMENGEHYESMSLLILGEKINSERQYDILIGAPTKKGCLYDGEKKLYSEKICDMFPNTMEEILDIAAIESIKNRKRRNNERTVATESYVPVG